MFAQSNLPACTGNDSSKWNNCHATLILSKSAKYIGEYKDGKRHGQGTFTFDDGSKYVGALWLDDITCVNTDYVAIHVI